MVRPPDISPSHREGRLLPSTPRRTTPPVILKLEVCSYSQAGQTRCCHGLGRYLQYHHQHPSSSTPPRPTPGTRVDWRRFFLELRYLPPGGGGRPGCPLALQHSKPTLGNTCRQAICNQLFGKRWPSPYDQATVHTVQCSTVACTPPWGSAPAAGDRPGCAAGKIPAAVRRQG